MMTHKDLGRRRLAVQHVGQAALEKPADVVASLGAVQAQDYAGALWAIGLRTRDATEKNVEGAIADKTLVRTWFMRGTLHLVPGADIRWMLDLMAPQMRRLIGNVSNYQKLGLDEKTLARSDAAIVRALQEGQALTRPELAGCLEQAGIAAGGLRLSLILQRAQADGLICYGARRGKQFTFVLLDEWMSGAKRMDREEALAEFSRRYFIGHGPATLQDFAWWSGLPAAEAKVGLEMIRTQLAQESIDGQTYWMGRDAPAQVASSRAAYLLPNYDEYTVGYKDRSASMGEVAAEKAESWGSLVLGPVVVLAGRVLGTWKRTLTRREVQVQVNPFMPLTKAQHWAVAAAAEQYGAFLGLPAALAVPGAAEARV